MKKLFLLIPIILLCTGMVSDKQRFTTGGAAGITPTTWNPSDKGANVTLSGSNLVASFGVDYQGVRSVVSKTGGKFYIELTKVSNSSDPSVGVANSTANLNARLNTQAGLAVVNAVGIGTSAIAGLAVDITNKRIWYNPAGAGWRDFAGTAADPTVSSSGTDFSALGGTIFIACGGGNFSSSADIWQANFGATAFTYTVPVGFTSGFGS